MRINSLLAAALASAFFGAASAQAAPVTYSDFASWSNAVSGTATVTTTFEVGITGSGEDLACATERQE